MPRYFFHIQDGDRFLDEAGTELGGLPEARSHAITTAGRLLQDIKSESWADGEWHMHVTDDMGSTILRLRFSTLGIAAIGNGTATLPVPVAYGQPLSQREARIVRAFRAIEDDEIQDTLLQLLENIDGQDVRRSPFN